MRPHKRDPKLRRNSRTGKTLDEPFDEIGMGRRVSRSVQWQQGVRRKRFVDTEGQQVAFQKGPVPMPHCLCDQFRSLHSTTLQIVAELNRGRPSSGGGEDSRKRTREDSCRPQKARDRQEGGVVDPLNKTEILIENRLLQEGHRETVRVLGTVEGCDSRVWGKAGAEEADSFSPLHADEGADEDGRGISSQENLINAVPGKKTETCG